MAVQPGRVGIVGLGLIGGSLGLDLQAQGWTVQGLVHRQATADRAMARGLVGAVSTDPQLPLGLRPGDPGVAHSLAAEPTG